MAANGFLADLIAAANEIPLQAILTWLLGLLMGLAYTLMGW